jgi:hypothetical protein
MSALENIANELHQSARRTFPRLKVITQFKDDLWQASLIDMQLHSKKSKGFKFKYLIQEVCLIFKKKISQSYYKQITVQNFTIINLKI